MKRFVDYIAFREADMIDDRLGIGAAKMGGHHSYEGTSSKLTELIKMSWEKYKSQTLAMFKDLADRESDSEMSELLQKKEKEGTGDMDDGEDSPGPDDDVKIPTPDSSEGDDGESQE